MMVATNKPEYFFALPWERWFSTQLVKNENASVQFMYGDENRCFTDSSSIEAKYPGFINGYDTLTAKGCDEFFVTAVMKHCILSSNLSRVDEFLYDPVFMASVDNALSLGLTGDDLTSYFMSYTFDILASDLPENMIF